MPADPAHPRIVIVRDPDDHPHTRTLLHRIDDLNRGVLLVRPTPGTTGLSELALAVLAALGKNLDQRPREHLRRWWDLARAWTIGHQIDHLIVDRAHTLPAEVIHHLTDLAGAAHATVWYLDAHPPGTAPALAGLDPLTVATPHHLLALADTTRRRQPRRPAPTRQIPPLSMPCAGFLTFRYACERQLPVDHVADVDAAWRSTFDATQGWLLRTTPYNRNIRPTAANTRAALPVLAATLSVQLAALLYTAANPSTALLRLRATEAALFRYGLLLRHRPQRGGGHDHLLRCRLTPLLAATINRAVSTNAATAAVLHLLYPLISPGHHDAQKLRSWRVDNLHPDGSRLLTAHGSIPVPADAQPALRAHLHYLHSAGKPDGESPLIDQQRHGQSDLAQQVLAGLNITPPPRPPAYPLSGTYLYGCATAWMADRGLSLHALSELRPLDDRITAIG